MKITNVESLHADAGQRNFDFLKISTDEGLVGWSEYNESFGGPGVSAVIERLAPAIIGKDPRAYESLVTLMYAMRRQAAGGVVQQAIGAIENALLDVKARALDIPVYELFGGPVRDRIRLYWSHCGTYRLQWSNEMQLPPLRTLDDVKAAGREAAAKGYTALKTNVFILGRQPYLHSPGFARRGPGFPELNAERYVVTALREELAAFREGAGPDMDILVDLNFNFKTEGFLKVARAIEPFDIFWVEIDTRDPEALAYIRRSARIPVASCECLFGRRDYRPYLERGAVDVAIIDTPWNGVAESLKIAAMADAYEVNVAPHNFYGHLATLMNAHFCAVVPNLRIMEIDPDTVPWYDDLVTHKPEIKDGHLLLSRRPGWGTEVNEEAVRAHPPRPRG
ncbi:MAG TPA: mandelate racemase/muconate lactonizing enzyme family protein [Methylomirabilota bacterium]|jgi:L-alanine-DL-glutamate epimerase-like enolase superfamily enzyme|nr:mandelate racemase/muconate lactonizing enzyme family protein [Methylomirabilota bacterium]